MNHLYVFKKYEHGGHSNPSPITIIAAYFPITDQTHVEVLIKKVLFSYNCLSNIVKTWRCYYEIMHDCCNNNNAKRLTVIRCINYSLK